jgi:uncharacterized protein (TIGR00255 family)
MGTKKKVNLNTTIASMTGYGRATGESPEGQITVEARSLNHRYLEVVIRAPKTVMYLDPEIRTLVKDRVSRGKVEIFINVVSSADNVTLDLDRARQIAEALEEIAEQLGDKVRLEHVLEAGEISVGTEQEVTPASEELLLETAGKALDSMVSHRITEGKSLAKDMVLRMEELSSIVENIVTLAPMVTDRVRGQVNEFIAGVNLGDLVDQTRLESEIALMSQKADISEEIIRLKTHLSAFLSAVSSGGVVGRRMDFLLQEIQREINTIGSKSGLTEISQSVVDFKTGLEKVREQVQNIE